MSADVTKRLRDRRLNVWEQLKWLTEEAALENRRFTAEEQGSWEVHNEELDSIDRRIKQALDAEQRAWQNREVLPLEDAAEVAQRLGSRRANVWEQIGVLADTVATENRAFTAEEYGSWEVLHEELEHLDERLAGALEQSKHNAMADEAFRRLLTKQPSVAHVPREDGPLPPELYGVPETVKRLRDRRLNVWEHAKALADKAAGEDRVFTPREQGTWEVLYGELGDLDKVIHEAIREAADG